MIYESKYTVQRAQDAPIVIPGVIVSSDDGTPPSKADNFYLCRALKLIDVKRSEAQKWKVIKIELIKPILGING